MRIVASEFHLLYSSLGSWLKLAASMSLQLDQLYLRIYSLQINIKSSAIHVEGHVHN